MEGLLTPVSTSYQSPRQNALEDALVEAPKEQAQTSVTLGPASTPEEALEVLKNEPSYTSLTATLNFLTKSYGGFSLTSPNPLAAQVVHVLVSVTVPDYWDLLQRRKTKAKDQEVALKLLVSCLQSVTGLNAVLLSLKRHIQLSKETKKAVGGPSIREVLRILLELMQTLLEGDASVQIIWKQIIVSGVKNPKQKAIWQEYLAIVGSGRILGLAAEAESVINELSATIGEKYWIANGSEYSLWLAGNILFLSRDLPKQSHDGYRNCAELLGRALRLGHTDSIVKTLSSSLILHQNEYKPAFGSLFSSLPTFEQRSLLHSLLKICSKDYLSTVVASEDGLSWWKEDMTSISAVAGLINMVLSNAETRNTHLTPWLTNSSGAGAGEGIAIRRAVLAVVSQDKTCLEKVFEKSLQQFGDQLYVRHSPILQQEAHCQVLLLASGYVHRQAPLHLKMIMRTGTHLNVVSNRLGASSPRARFLGMIVGEALSSLVDKADSKMDFKMEDMNTAEAKWYKSLIGVADTVGAITLLRSTTTSKFLGKQKSHPPAPAPAKVKKIPVPTGSKIISIEEIETDEEESGDGELVPHAKPDSDAEDSDDDPTLITRNKPTAPVYVRDLITYLRDTENYDHQKLGLSTTAPLIRRKANFGTEVSAHAEELATLLVGIQDKYEIENFQDMRLQGMIAILIALPLKMGQWFSKTFFDGDYSISQRASILTTLGLGARELGGYGTEEAALSKTKSPMSNFPSKTLPTSTAKHYTPPQPTAIDALSTQMTHSMIAPMAASLADTLTGPSILKIRTFSSRMAVEASRSKPTTNALAKIVAEGFFFPLTGRFFMHLKAFGSSSHSVIFQPYLLAHFVKTLALLFHASGPNTLSLPQMTSEFWDLLLRLRAQSLGEKGVLEAVLFAFLTLLEVNEEKRGLVEAHGRQLLETQEWVEGVFGKLSGGGEEDERVRMLAAGVLVRIREVVEKYQRALMGDLASF